MKLYFSSIYSVVITITVMLMLYVGNSKNEKAVKLRNQLYLILAMDVMYFVSFFVNDYRFLVVNYSIVLILEVLIIDIVVNFAFVYGKVGEGFVKTVRTIASIFTVLDVIVILINSFSEIFYSFYITTSSAYGEIIKPNVSGFFLAHIVYCILMEILLSVMMFRMARKGYHIFKGRYILLGFSFSVGLVVCSVIRIYTGFLNYPIVFLLTLCEVIIFYSYLFQPRARMKVMKDFVIGNTTAPLLMFDYDDELQVINEPAKSLLNVSEGISLEEFVKGNDLKLILTKERRAAGRTEEFTLTTKHGDRTYLIHGRELRDKHSRYAGTLLIYNDISRQEELKEEATYHATRDAMTGLWNREYFLEMMKKTLEENPSEEFILVLSDIAQFKLFNEILGKKTGDDLILSIAEGFNRRRLPKWLLARIEGDRFALMMPYKDYDEKRFIDVCNSVIDARGYGLTVRYYLGCYHIKDRIHEADELVNRAEMALEDCGNNKTGIITYYNEEFHDRMVFGAISTEELYTALKEEQFEMYLQPQIDIQNNKIVGAEALVRWNHPKRGLVSPGEFIAVFEENCMINELDYYVWEKACKQLDEWKKKGKEEYSISVNISAKDFYLSDIYENIVGLVEKYDVDPRKLKLEITETAFALNVKDQMSLVKKLQGYGFAVEIDDFGSGYSSLNSLKDLSVDVLKLDMKFFEKTEDDLRAEKVVESIVNLAYNLRMPVIAEGVETEEHVELLKRIGCRIVQGYYYSKPVPVNEFEQFAENYTFEDLHSVIEELMKIE